MTMVGFVAVAAIAVGAGIAFDRVFGALRSDIDARWQTETETETSPPALSVDQETSAMNVPEIFRQSEGSGPLQGGVSF